jgi:hypothetical protein
LERVREQLTTGIPRGLRIDLSGLGVGNSQQVNLLDHIAAQSLDVFKSNGVSVMKIQPDRIFVNVEPITTLVLPVNIPAEINTLTADTRFAPASVTVSGPASLLPKDCKAFADLTEGQIPKKPGPYTLASIGIKLSVPREKLRIDPPQVQGELVVRDADVPFEIPHMNIYIKSPYTWLAKNDITLPSGDTIDDIHVTGPADKIKLLKDGTFNKLQAVLEVLPDDAQHRKQLTYVLPEGVTVSPVDQQRQWDYTLTPK